MKKGCNPTKQNRPQAKLADDNAPRKRRLTPTFIFLNIFAAVGCQQSAFIL